ncbi:Photosystem I reaction center subunit chloroplastic [Micractinium conductrix]|uniref:PSI-G n=1 Tax=Micractinium conductrix TaxID=554055 RepID=A0A2P6V2P1_9CHLO|nr:Photosystem I reaction center subunit chloroplastic [Micractinium conductrix]|eukprot:PSC68341.1 Photosystem I reaction center subunit chloroplastic [Micractinium conductrix]
MAVAPAASSPGVASPATLLAQHDAGSDAPPGEQAGDAKQHEQLQLQQRRPKQEALPDALLPEGQADADEQPAAPQQHDQQRRHPHRATKANHREPLPARALAAWRAWGLRDSPHFRRAVQCSVGTLLLMLIFSPPAVWQALTVSPASANPQIIFVIFYMVLLVSLSTGDAPVRVAAHELVGSLGGGVVGLAVVYLAYAINGGSYHDSWAKALTIVLLSAGLQFWCTVMRFRRLQHTLAWQFASLTFALTTAGSYHAREDMWKFTCFWWAYSAIGGAVAFLCATFVLPITAGSIVRRQLAGGLGATAEVLNRALDLMTGEVAPDSGLLAAASGETAERIGLDSGLWPQLQPLYAAVERAGQAIQNSHRLVGLSRWQLDVYRRQRHLPAYEFHLMVTMARTLLNAVMMLVYPVQGGTMHVLLVARQRAPLLALGAAMAECCAALGSTLVHNAPVAAALEKLTALESSYAALAKAASFKGSTLTQDRMALDMVLSLLFTACTRVRRLFVLLPEALGKDQPGAVGPVLDHFLPETQGEAPEWDFARLTQIPLQRGDSNPLDMLRASLLAAQPRRTPSSAALNMLAAPELKTASKRALVEKKGAAWARRAAQLLLEATGVQGQHLAVGLQLVAAYTPVLIMLVIPSVNEAFNHSLPWSLFVVTSVIEPNTGAAIFKGLQRFAGTLLAGGLGVGAQYTVFLLNGLNYQMDVGKAAAMTVALSLLAGALAAAGVAYARFSYAFIIATVILALTALPGFQESSPAPLVALWRVVATALGVGVEVLAVSLVMPVTAKQLFRAAMVSTLDQMAGVARAAFAGYLPQLEPPAGSSAAQRSRRQLASAQQHKGQEQQQEQQQEQREQEQQPAPLPRQRANGSVPPPSPFVQPTSVQPASFEQQVQQHGHIAIEMTAGHSTQLRALRTRSPLDGPSLRQRTGSGGRPGPLQLPPVGLSDSDTAQPRDSIGSGQAVTPTAPGSAVYSPRSPRSDDSSVSRLSVYASYASRAHTFRVIGSLYARLLPDAMSTSAGIVQMLQLNMALKYEIYPFARFAHRFPFESGFRAQRLCRHMLNVVAGAIIVLDSHSQPEVHGLRLLAPFAERLEGAIEQLAACLEALAALVREQETPDSAVATVLSLEEHCQRLFLLVLAADPPPGLTEADLIHGLALLATLFNAAYVSRLLALALIRSFAPALPDDSLAAAKMVCTAAVRAAPASGFATKVQRQQAVRPAGLRTRTVTKALSDVNLVVGGSTIAALALGRFVFLPFHRASLAKAGMPTQNGQTHAAAGDSRAEEASFVLKTNDPAGFTLVDVMAWGALGHAAAFYLLATSSLSKAPIPF